MGKISLRERELGATLGDMCSEKMGRAMDGKVKMKARQMMRVLICASTITQKGGSSNHLYHFVPALAEVDETNEYFVVLHKTFPFEYKAPNVHILRTSAGIISAPYYMWWYQIELPWLCKRLNIDLIFALLSFGSVKPPKPQIVLVRNPTYFSEYYISTLAVHERLKLAIGRMWLYRTMKASRLIITPTKAMKDDIKRVYPNLREERFRVVPYAVELEYEENSGKSMHPRGKINILYVSHPMPHKNYEIIPQVARILRDRRVDFTISFTGKRESWSAGYDRVLKEARKLGVSSHIFPVGTVPPEKVGGLYRAADIFFFPSLCESFGFPMVEAMSFGLPIVAADTPVNREICGNAALYFEPRNARDAADKLSQLFLGKKRKSQELTSFGLNRLSAFPDWERYAKRLVDLFSEATDRTATYTRS